MPALGRQVGDRLEQRTLGREAREKELPDPERPAVEPAAADEERVGAGAAGEAGGLEIDEQQTACRTSALREQRQSAARRRRTAAGRRPGPSSHGDSRRVRAIDDEEALAAALVPFAVEDVGDGSSSGALEAALPYVSEDPPCSLEPTTNDAAQPIGQRRHAVSAWRHRA